MPSTRKKRTLELAGARDFDNYVDSLATANTLDSIRRAKINDYRNVIIDEHNVDVQRNREDVRNYGPLAIFPLFYRAGKDMLFGKKSDRLNKARNEAIKAKQDYENFIKR